MSTSLLSRVQAAAVEAPASGRPAPGAAPDPELVQAAETETVDALDSWLVRYEDHIGRRLPSHMETGAFLAAVRDRLPALRGCTKASILDAVMTCASFGLVPDGREAVLTREGPVAVFIPTYRGYIRAMHNAGFVTSVRVELVYPGDEFTYEPTAPSPLDLTHRPKLGAAREKGEPEFAYAFAWLRGGDRSQPVILTREDAEEIRDRYSRAYQRAVEEGRTDTFWHTDFWHMVRKSCIRRLIKLVPVSAEVRALEAVEDAAEEGRPQLGLVPDPEEAGLLADAERAAKAAEASQEVATRPLPVKPSKARRGRGKKDRAAGRASRRRVG